MNDTKRSHWVFRARVVDRAGALTSIASAFSNEGISIETVVGHGLEKGVQGGGSIVLTCYCTENEMDMIVRKIKRLSKVIELKQHPYESGRLRKSVIALISRKLVPRDVAGKLTFLTCELVEKTQAGYIYFLAGAPSELDLVLKGLEKERLIKDLVYSIVGL